MKSATPVVSIYIHYSNLSKKRINETSSFPGMTLVKKSFWNIMTLKSRNLFGNPVVALLGREGVLEIVKTLARIECVS